MDTAPNVTLLESLCDTPHVAGLPSDVTGLSLGCGDPVIADRGVAAVSARGAVPARALAGGKTIGLAVLSDGTRRTRYASGPETYQVSPGGVTVAVWIDESW